METEDKVHEYVEWRLGMIRRYVEWKLVYEIYYSCKVLMLKN